MESVTKLNRLPVYKTVELSIHKLAHKSLYDKSLSEYLKLNLHKVCAYSVRSLIAPVLSIPRESATFRHSAAAIFNKLPVAITNTTEYNSFYRNMKRHFFFLLNTVHNCQ